MKTKPFLLATAGATVDGRTIDANMLTEMAEGYDPKTYGARLNVEHIRGLSGDKPFRAFGDVLELSTSEVDVNIHGKTEKRVGLFGVLDINDDAKALNEQGQKVYPSIEIEPNFAGSGKAYLMGVALTDSPASIATERMAFNRSLPGAITLATDAADQASTIEFADASGNPTDAGATFLTKLGDTLDKAFGKLGGGDPKPEPKTDPKPAEQANDFAAQMRPLIEGLGQQFATTITGLQSQIADRDDQVELRFKALETKLETTPAQNHSARPAAAGSQGNATKTDC